MNINFYRAMLSILIFFPTLLGFSSSAFSKCNTKPIISKAAVNQEWKEINNDYPASSRKAHDFTDFNAGFVKLLPAHHHPLHYYKNKLLVFVVEGSLEIDSNNKRTSYKKGDYFIIPAYSCFSSHSKNGATIILLGAKPGDSYPSSK